MHENMTRREILAKIASLGLSAAGLSLLPLPELKGILWTVEAAAKPTLAVASGGTVESKVKRLFGKLGGIGKFVRKGATVVLKPNIGWARRPEQAANTNPELVEHVAKLCYAAGAKEVAIYEHSVDNHLYCFQMSGIKDVAEKAGVRLTSVHQAQYFEAVSMPKGKVLKEDRVVSAVLKADCLINLPIAKCHSAATLTLGMKNMMGIIDDRRAWHLRGLNQCIADFATRVRAHLTILDGTRILLTNGPKGPGKVKIGDLIAASVDPVAVDAYGATLFGYSPGQVPHIQLAHEAGLGEIDFKKIRLVTA